MSDQTSVTIRQATLADLDAIVPLFDAYRVFYEQPSDPARGRAFLLERFQHNQSVIFVSEDADGAAVGFTQLYPVFSSTRTARTYILNDLYVAPSGRRNGVGTLLLRAAADYAREVGAYRLTLSTAVTNLPGQGLYESAGWRRDQEFYTYHLVL